MSVLEKILSKYCIVIMFSILLLEILHIVPFSIGILIQCCIGILLSILKIIKYYSKTYELKVCVPYIMAVIILTAFILIESG